MKISALLVCLVLVFSCAIAGAQTAEELSISKKSTFDASGNRRDPFVPIGWTKQAPAGVAVVSGTPTSVSWESYVRPEAFSVSSISLDRLPLAVINGKAYGEGDSIPFIAGTSKIKVQVLVIRDGGVILGYNDLKVTCPIRHAPKAAAAAK